MQNSPAATHVTYYTDQSVSPPGIKNADLIYTSHAPGSALEIVRADNNFWINKAMGGQGNVPM